MFPDNTSGAKLSRKSESHVFMAASSNSQRLYENENIDMISRLPDEVLVHIMSFLSTKDAFKTSVLSSRWETLWTAVPNLVFFPNKGFSGLFGQSEDPRYLAFIKMIFQSHDSSINKFQLECTPEVDKSVLKDWVSVVVERNVQDIYISLPYKVLKLPESLFISKTLVSLKLHFTLQFDDVPVSIHFPCLKVFDIIVCSPTNHLTERLFCSSPVLEDLKMWVREDSGELVYNISSPCLRKLFVWISPSDIRNFNSVVNVDAPILESMKVVHVGCPRYNLKNSSSLVEAAVGVRIYDDFDQAMINTVGENVVMLLNSLSSVKDLYLGDRFSVLLFDNFNSSSCSRWPAFPHLKHLKLDMDEEVSNASNTWTELLALAPNLVSLEFANGYFRIKPKLLDCSEELSCLQSCLKKIVLKFHRFAIDHLNLIKYFLINAQVLEEMTVAFPAVTSISGLLKVEKYKLEIDMMPRCSKCCKLVFTIDD